MLASLNPMARRTLRSLLTAHPEWRSYAHEREGEVVLEVPAPGSSQVGCLVVQTHAGNIWLRVAQPCTGCFINHRREMKRLVRAILKDELVFVIVMRGKTWVETMLAEPTWSPPVRRGQTVRVLSWSGAHDRVLRGRPQVKAGRQQRR